MSRRAIAVMHHKYSAVQNVFIHNRERLRRQFKFPVLFGHVDGLSELFAARRSSPAYILFDLKRGGAKKKTFEKILRLEISVCRKLLLSRKLVGCVIFRKDLNDSSAWVDLKIHHSACQSCSDSYLTCGISELKNLVLDIPIAGPPIIDFK